VGVWPFHKTECHSFPQIREHVIDYTDCTPIDQPAGSNQTCADILLNNDLADCKCKIDFVLEKDFLGKVYMYYGLTNYYQNHRRYVRSRDDEQLLGRLSQTPASECGPFQFDENNRPIAPCGAIANSLFSDKLDLKSLVHNTNVPVLNTGIAWPSDKNIRFRNPEGNLQEALKDFAAPKHWRGRTLATLDPDNESNNGFQNEDLIVWMRTAALPSFRKLYRRIDHSKTYFADGLHKGNYTLNVDYTYSVKEFSGRKKFILSTTSLLGGKNPFLGVAYIVVGSVCLLIGIILLFIHIKCSKR
jgi:LEM3 (ligand-effect modulator 3) family / CDC50 family